MPPGGNREPLRRLTPDQANKCVMVIAGLLASLPLAAAVACLCGPRVSRVARWLPLLVGLLALAEGGILLTAERSFYRGIVTLAVSRGSVPVVLVLWDWVSVAVIAAGLVGAAFAFAGSPPAPRQDAWVLLNLSLLAVGVSAGSPAVVYLVLAGAAGSYVLAMLGARGLTAGHVAFGLAGVTASVVGSLGWSHAIALTTTGSGYEFLLDICLFPQSRLDDSPLLARSLLGGLALMAGLWPFCMAAGPGWRALGSRLGAASLAVGPQCLALGVWLRVLAHGGAQVGTGLALDGVTGSLLAVVGLAVVWHAGRLATAFHPVWCWTRRLPPREPALAPGVPETALSVDLLAAQAENLCRTRTDARHASEEATLGALASLQLVYAALALLLASMGVARAYYALFGCLATLALSAPGTLAGIRLRASELSPAARTASWASLVGAPPFVGFFARFLLISSAVEGLGPAGAWLVVPWLLELAAVVYLRSEERRVG